MPIADFPGIGASMRTRGAASASAISLLRVVMRFTRIPCAGWSSNLVITGPTLIFTIRAEILKLLSVSISTFAFSVGDSDATAAAGSGRRRRLYGGRWYSITAAGTTEETVFPEGLPPCEESLPPTGVDLRSAGKPLCAVSDCSVVLCGGMSSMRVTGMPRRKSSSASVESPAAGLSNGSADAETAESEDSLE